MNITYADRKRFKRMVARRADIERRWPQIIATLKHAAVINSPTLAATVLPDVRFAWAWDEMGRTIDKALMEGVKS